MGAGFSVDGRCVVRANAAARHDVDPAGSVFDHGGNDGRSCVGGECAARGQDAIEAEMDGDFDGGHRVGQQIDGTVQLLPPEKVSKTLKTGEFTKARIVGVRGHDLVAQPF